MNLVDLVLIAVLFMAVLLIFSFGPASKEELEEQKRACLASETDVWSRRDLQWCHNYLLTLQLKKDQQ
jgi:hypothetical protein